MIEVGGHSGLMCYSLLAVLCVTIVASLPLVTSLCAISQFRTVERNQLQIGSCHKVEVVAEGNCVRLSWLLVLFGGGWRSVGPLAFMGKPLVQLVGLQ